MLKDRVLKLLNILKNLESAPREVILKAQELAITAFTGLSLFDQDTIAMEMYVKDENLRDYLGLDDLQTMTTFNRITALRDDQVRNMLVLLWKFQRNSDKENGLRWIVIPPRETTLIRKCFTPFSKSSSLKGKNLLPQFFLKRYYQRSKFSSARVIDLKRNQKLSA